MAARAEMEAGLAALDGRLDQAGDLYPVAIDAWRTLNGNLDVVLTELELVHLLGSDHSAAAGGEEAKYIFTQLGAVPYLAKLEVD